MREKKRRSLLKASSNILEICFVTFFRFLDFHFPVSSCKEFYFVENYFQEVKALICFYHYFHDRGFVEIIVISIENEKKKPLLSFPWFAYLLEI